MESVHELIEKRAYELFLARGGENGYAIQDWAIAEKEILAQIDKERKAAAKTEKKETTSSSVQAPTAVKEADPVDKTEPKKKVPVKKAAKK